MKKDMTYIKIEKRRFNINTKEDIINGNKINDCYSCYYNINSQNITKI